MSEITKQLVIFSNSPLKGNFRFKNQFQILPLEVNLPSFAYDYPLILEVTFDPDVYPDRKEDYWHRDIWEKERFERITQQSIPKRMDPNDPWVEAYQTWSISLRWPAILKEVMFLLTFFSKHRFYIYENDQSWFVSIKALETAEGVTESEWGYQGFRSDDIGGEISKLSESDCVSLPLLNQKEFARRFRDTKGYSAPDQIEFPISMGPLLERYFSLSSEQKSAFYTALHFYCQALYYKNRLPSLSLIASVMAIERIMNLEYGAINQCPDCNVPLSIEKCPTCEAPKYRLRSRFRKFMAEYSLPDQDKLYKDMYDARSRISHGELLRDDLFDTGFYAGENDNEDLLRRNSLICVNDALVQWLIRLES